MDEATEVNQPATEAPQLLVEMDFYRPKFTFKGNWNGKSTKVVRNLLWRAWLRHQQMVRHNNLAQIQEAAQ